MTVTQITVEMLNDFTSSLLANRCDNYGYIWKDFRRISNQRSKARTEFRSFVKYFTGTLIERIEQESRIQLENGKLTYIVGQSSNEEITNLMRRLVNPKDKWVS
jgi:hypothetical protein